MGLSPDLWGSQGWHYIHMVALNYPDYPTREDKYNYYNFFKFLQKTIPCPHCSIHFGENMKIYPIRLENRDSLFRWTVDMHNAVNIKNNKRVLTYQEAFDEINNNAIKHL